MKVPNPYGFSRFLSLAFTKELQTICFHGLCSIKSAYMGHDL